MAEGYLKHVYEEYYEVYSAGPETTINHYAIKVMGEIGIDISNHHSKSLEEFEGMKFDHVMTVCGGARQACPFFPGGKKYTHKGFKDPAAVEGNGNKKIKMFREVRDKIISWIDESFKK